MAFLFQCGFLKGINNLLFLQPSNSILLFKKYILVAVAKQNIECFFFCLSLYMPVYLPIMSMITQKP